MSKKQSDSKVLKNHISSLDTKTLQNVLSSRFGVSLQDLEDVVAGNTETAKRIGEFGRQGRFANKYAPKIAQSIVDGIQGTLAMNEATAQVLQAAGKADTAILKHANKTLQANQRYNHDKTEIAQEYAAAKSLEDKRHEYATTYIEMRAFYDEYFLSVDEDSRLEQQGLRPDLKQIKEDQRIQEQEIGHLLEHGENHYLELLPAKDYVETQFNQVGGTLSTIKGFLSSVKSGLGF